MTVTLSTTAKKSGPCIIIPTDALYFDGGEAYVYLDRDGRAVRTDVELELYTPEQAAISGGLNEGDQLVTTWSSRLKDGAPIRTADAPPAEGAGQQEP